MNNLKIKNALFAGYTSIVMLILLISLAFLIPFTLVVTDYIYFSNNKLISSFILLTFLLLIISSLLFVIHKSLLKPTKEEKELINKNVQNEWRSITKDETEMVQAKLLPRYNVHPLHDIIFILILGFILPLLEPRFRLFNYEFSIILIIIIAAITLFIHYIYSYIIFLRKKWYYSNFESNHSLAKVIDIPIIKTYMPYSGPFQSTYNKLGVFILSNKKYVIKIPSKVNKYDKIKIINFSNNTIILF